jgi:chromosome segregation ATPase
MSSLELLKHQIEIINNRLTAMEKDIDKRKEILINLNTQKEDLEINIKEQEIKYNEISKNYKYLTEVKLNTTENYNQILESANTLLDILKNKCDGV